MFQNLSHDLESYSITYRTSARYEDIDANNHMNNASYAQMFYESIAGNLQGAELASIDISFKGEVSVHDELVCLSEPGADGVLSAQSSDNRLNLSDCSIASIIWFIIDSSESS